MTPFLKQVAAHYFDLGALDRRCFVFPNRRALVFFKKYLGECVSASGATVLAPACVTVNDLFYKFAGKTATDRVTLLMQLYDCFKPIYEQTVGKQAESLDEFIFWGGVILSDFNDVDKYLVDAAGIFTNIAQYKQMQADMSFLSETQRSALEKFLGNFKTEGDIKSRFQTVWDLLLPLYRNFNAVLEESGMSYEGQVYRSLALRLDEESVADMAAENFPDTDCFVFTGLNALNACEKKLLKKLKNAGMAEFCWDYSSPMIKDRRNKASMFMAANLEDFPQEFQLDPEGLPKTSFNVLSVASGVGQAKQLPSILGKLGRADIHTAIVLPDENLLIPVLNSIPDSVEQLNVTMGYPIGGSELWPLIMELNALQSHLRQKDGKWYFYHRQVWSILGNGLIKALMGDEGKTVADKIHKESKYYVDAEEFRGNRILSCIFTPVVKDMNSTDPEQIKAIGGYQQHVIEILAEALKETEDMSLELDFAREIYQATKRMQRESRAMLPSTYFRLMQQLMSGAAVPFKGEPLNGLQIMGPLETRALDFDNIIILSCNEGTFPRNSSSSSYIPGELRKGFDLPTFEYKDAMWAYYFYRMIQRASCVWMLYDSRTEGVKVGEESRFIKQLRLHFGVSPVLWTEDSRIVPASPEGPVPKTEEHLKLLRERHLSASALKNYLDCQVKFLYANVLGLKPDEEVSESLDASMVGNVFHSVMEELYKRKVVTDEYVEGLLKDKSSIRNLVREKICAQIGNFELSGRNIIFHDIICKYVCQALLRDLEHMRACNVHSFKILGLELLCKSQIGGLEFIGYIDRLDSFVPGEIRVVDYKTGKVTDDDFLIDEGNAKSVVANLFGDNYKKRPKIALQLYLYDVFAKERSGYKGEKIVNSIYQTSRLFVRQVEQVELCETFCREMKIHIDDLIAQIMNPEIPFERTGEKECCNICDFKQICGR